MKRAFEVRLVITGDLSDGFSAGDAAAIVRDVFNSQASDRLTGTCIKAEARELHGVKKTSELRGGDKICLQPQYSTDGFNSPWERCEVLDQGDEEGGPVTEDQNKGCITVCVIPADRIREDDTDGLREFGIEDLGEWVETWKESDGSM